MKHSRSPLRAQPAALARALVLLATLAVAVGAAAFEPLAGAHYEFGRGLELPALNLDLRGYTTLHARDVEGEGGQVQWHDLSVFAIWTPTPTWQLFTEIEGEELVADDHRGLNSGDAEVQVERLYLDHTVDRYATLRVGRFLTPFGRWNQIHADPLVWTVTRPLVTVITIPDHVDGAMVYGTVPLSRDSIEYSAYIDASDEMEPGHGQASFEDYHLPGLTNAMEHAVGGQLRYHFLDERAQLGLSYASFAVEGGRGYHHAVGIDGFYTWHRFELSSELVYRANLEQSGRDDWGGFVQAVVPLVAQIYGVGRLEYYSSGVLARDARRGTVGLVWRPQPALSFKLEYHDGSDRSLLPDGVELSCGVMF
jgi:hypothetical protein